MKSKSASAWSAAKSEELYGFKRWGAGHYSVDPEGFVNVHPQADDRSIRVLDVVNEALGMGLQAPIVVRFQDLLRHRVIQLNELFRQAIKQEGYKGEYRGVFPIKVNQLREVVDEIVHMLNADGEADGLGADPRGLQLVRGELAVGGRRRVGDQGLGVPHVDQALEQLDAIEHGDARVITASHAKGDNRRAPLP